MSINNKQQAFINEYMINGHNASKAYKKAYPDCNGGWDRHGHRLMINDEIKAEITIRMAENKADTSRTIESLDKMYQETYDLAKLTKIPAAMNQAVTGIARLYGMDKDNVVQTDHQRELDAEQAERAEEIARISNMQAIKARTG